MTPLGDDERRIGRRLRRLVDGPTAHDAARGHAAGHPDTPADTRADTVPAAAPAPPAAPAADTGTGHGGQATVRRLETARVRRASARPDGVQRGGGRYPDWRRGDLADITLAAPTDAPPPPATDTPADMADVAAPDTADTVADTSDAAGPEQPAKSRRRLRLLKAAPVPASAPLPPELAVDEAADDDGEAAPGAPVNVTKRPGVAARWAHSDLADDGRLRFLFFNGTAAGAGYALGLVPRLERYLPASAQSATGTIAAVLALLAAVAVWRFTRIPYVRDYLPMAQVTRPIVTAVAAEIARRLAPVAVAYPDRYGTRYGLDAHAVSLLLTCGGLAFGLWWLIDRRTVAANWWWGARWLARIPLASVVLATALYAPGNTV
ncbi:hypothetical protein VSR01_16340 [Actinacidiphila sp. DG2A-62]|uniref:hypothetical protein n=1 Tax=Actinacidiphila sp. DG2A-62 TaxID=3108821 RepID=UPI002DB95D91|nr:hypothetical protein [Actinacidiphila sp. DG2A-62]MEC3995015.1 hypothetical protein [Actinacidiphila sp. DG2A-62]